MRCTSGLRPISWPPPTRHRRDAGAVARSRAPRGSAPGCWHTANRAVPVAVCTDIQQRQSVLRSPSHLRGRYASSRHGRPVLLFSMQDRQPTPFVCFGQHMARPTRLRLRSYVQARRRSKLSGPANSAAQNLGFMCQLEKAWAGLEIPARPRLAFPPSPPPAAKGGLGSST
jgi:hypothetical protein